MGKYGPYHQSERVDIYKTVAKYMVEKGYAYPSFAMIEIGRASCRERV